MIYVKPRELIENLTHKYRTSTVYKTTMIQASNRGRFNDYRKHILREILKKRSK